MPREYDGDESNGRFPRTSRFPIWAVIVLGAGVVVSMVCCAGVVVFWWTGQQTAMRRAADERAAKVSYLEEWNRTGITYSYHRDQFSEMVMGKTEDQVRAAVVGKPVEQGEQQGVRFWRYREITLNPATGKPDPSTFVRFNAAGVVIGVDY